MENQTFLIQRIDPHAILPTRGHVTDAGIDLYALEDVPVGVGVVKVRTGIAVALPEGIGAWIQGRSGLTSQGIIVHQGLIDPDYRGELLVMVSQHPEANYRPPDPLIKAGTRFAQLVPFIVPALRGVVVDELPTTERGFGGFGSTGAQ